MYENLVKRLREYAKEHCPLDRGSGICGCIDAREAADAIEELSRKVENLEAMREISPEAEYAIDKHADNLISHMEELISGLKDKPRWIPVAERLPEQGQQYIVVRRCPSGDLVRETLWYDGKDLWWNRLCKPYGGITHWMPLPAPPKEETE